MKQRGTIGLITLAAVCVAYIILRFWHLTDSCLWFDEIFSVHAAGMDFQNLIWFVAQDLIHPPLSYILLKIWILTGGESLFWLRFFPVFFSILALIPLIFLCRALKLSYPTAAVAVLFLAVNGCLIKYAQEVRMYSLLLFFAILSMWLFVRFLHLGKNIWILTIVNVLLVYTHYFGWLVVLSEITAIIVLQRIKIRQTLVMFGILLAGFAPWIFAVWKAAQLNANLGQNIGWIAQPNFATLFQFLFDLIEPFYFQQSNVEASSFFIITVPLLLLIMTAFTIYLIEWKSETEEEKQNLILLTIFTKLPVLLAFAASWILPYSVWGTRHLIFVFVPFAILTAVALTKIKVAPLVAIFLGLICLLFGAAFFVQTKRKTPVYIWCAWEALAANLDKNKPSKIYVFEDLVAYDMWFALRDAGKNFEIVKVNGIEELPEDTAYFLPRGFDKVQTTQEDGITGDRFYIAYRDAAFNEKHPPLKNLIDKGYQIGTPDTFETPGLKGFLVEVWR
jgi:mannosyltransferase